MLGAEVATSRYGRARLLQGSGATKARIEIRTPRVLTVNRLVGRLASTGSAAVGALYRAPTAKQAN